MGACSVKEDYIFDESATARIRAYINNCTAELTKPEYGWKMLFEPNKTRLGGYNVLMSFREDGTVRMLTDFLEEESTSTYTFNESQGPVLSFDSYSCLHYLADPRITPVGTGLEGEFEFVIKEVSSDSLVFYGKKYGNRIVFYPAAEADWSVNMENFRKHIDLMKPQDQSPFFRGLTMNQTAVNLVYDPASRAITYSYSDEITKQILSGWSGVYGTSDGVRFSPEIHVNGVVLDELKYNEKSRLFEANTPGVIGSLKYSHKPPFPFYNSIDQMRSASSFIGTPRLGSISSGNINSMLEFVNAIMGGHSMYMSSEFQAGYRALIMAGMKQFRITWSLDYNGTERGPWVTFYGALSAWLAEEESIYSLNNLLEMEIMREERDQIRFTINEDNIYQTNSGEFANLMRDQTGYKAFMDFIADPAGFTIVPSVNKRFYLVNLADSRRWLLLTKE